MHKSFGSVLFWVLLVTTAVFGHLCNNIYRTPDRVIVKPEKQSTTVAGTEEFRVFVQNNYPTLLNNVRLIAKVDTAALDVSVTPESIGAMKAAQREAFTVRLTARQGAKAERRNLNLSISADQIGFRPVEEASTEALRAVVTNDPNGAANIQAAESLIKRKDSLGSEYLQRFVTNAKGNQDYCSRAIRALGKGGDKSNTEFLRSLLQEQNGFYRGNALLCLGLLKDDVKTFRAQFEDRDEFVRACAVAGLVLGGNKDKAYLDWLKQGLQARNVFVRIACGWALASQRDKEGVNVLDEAFNTNDAMRRVMAGDALVDIVTRS